MQSTPPPSTSAPSQAPSPRQNSTRTTPDTADASGSGSPAQPLVPSGPFASGASPAPLRLAVAPTVQYCEGAGTITFQTDNGPLTLRLEPTAACQGHSHTYAGAHPPIVPGLRRQWSSAAANRPHRLRPAPDSSVWSGVAHAHGPEFSFYSQFVLITCYYLLEYLEVLNVANRPQGFISGVPAVILVLTILNSILFRVMRRLQILTVLVELLCFIGLLVYDEITPENMDDRHRTEYYDMHAHAAALNFVLFVLYGAVWTSGFRSWMEEEHATEAVLSGDVKPVSRSKLKAVESKGVESKASVNSDLKHEEQTERRGSLSEPPEAIV